MGFCAEGFLCLIEQTSMFAVPYFHALPPFLLSCIRVHSPALSRVGSKEAGSEAEYQCTHHFQRRIAGPLK
jgi:hypothetical protein